MTTAAGRRLIAQWPEWSPGGRPYVVRIVAAIEAEAAARAVSEALARVRRAIDNVPEASHQRVGPRGWRHISRDAVLAILDAASGGGGEG